MSRHTINLSDNAVYLLEQRYLRKDEKRRIIETPEELFRRVSHAIASVEKGYGKGKDEIEELEDRFYEAMTSLTFIPNSPTLMNAGTRLGQLSACFVVGIEDSIWSIMEGCKRAAIIHQSGGGTGFSFSNIRPKGDIVRSTGGIASGVVSFMRIFDATTSTIKQGGKRRGANMGVLRCDHPEIIDFIGCKEKEQNFVNFNISVSITNKFMNAVLNDDDFDLINPRTSEVDKTVRARMIWNLILIMGWRNGEPGLLFLDTINESNPTPNEPIEATNPCITGDTLVAVADGRNAVKIKDLAIEGRDVPVYTWSSSEKRMIIRMGRNPRKTRTNVDVFRITLDDGSQLDATYDHKILLKDGTYKEIRNIQKSESLIPFWKIQYRQLGKKSRYWQVHQNKGILHLAEHKLMMEFLLNRRLREDEVIHHKDFDSLNNFFNNLELMLSKEHRKLHSKRMLGNNNPYHKMSEEWKLKFATHLGESNGMWGKSHSKETKEKIRKKAILRFQNMDAEDLKVFSLNVKNAMNEKVRKKISEKMKERWKNNWVSSDCPVCSDEIRYRKSKPQVCCSRSCANTFRGFKNHKIIRKEYLGKKDVFNITVDDTHNFAIITKDYKSKKGNRKLSGILISNCGELPLLPGESCNLGSINLTKFVRDGRIQWKELKETIELATRFLDNVIDANKYPFDEIKTMTLLNRKIGLGIMGWADILIMRGVRYGSAESYQLARKLMKFITDTSRNESRRLGEEKGNFPNKENSIWQTEEFMKNATVTTIAPTGSISIIAGCNSGIEPLFSLAYKRAVGASLGKPLLEFNATVKEVLGEITINEEGSVVIPEDLVDTLVVAKEVSTLQHIRMQAAFQKYVDNSISKTINLPENATIYDIETAYLEAFNTGCKGVTVYRNNSRTDQLLTEIEAAKCAKGTCDL